MRQDLTKKLEHIKVEIFHTDQDGSTEIEPLLLEIPVGSSLFARAAMLKGLNEFMYKRANAQGEDMFDSDTLQRIESALKEFSDRMESSHAKSRLILP
jgi:hypothetical protein